MSAWPTSTERRPDARPVRDDRGTHFTCSACESKVENVYLEESAGSADGRRPAVHALTPERAVFLVLVCPKDGVLAVEVISR